VKITTVNIQAAGLPRAKALLSWLDGRDDDVVVLTETSGGPGTAHLLDQCRAAGWTVVATQTPGDRGCAIVSRLPVQAADITAGVSIPARVAACRLPVDPEVLLLGIYVPSNDRAPAKAAKKRDFLASVRSMVQALPPQQRAALIVAGDYNLVTRDHVPAYPGVFTVDDYAFLDALGELGLADGHRHLHPEDQPHSWIGHGGNGYRYDYVHLATALTDQLLASAYLHETRDSGLSDHAAVSIELDLAASSPFEPSAQLRLASAGALF
jgi:exonuclease III